MTSLSIGWAQFQLRGGWKNLLLTSGCYLAALAMLIYFPVRYEPRAATRILQSMMYVVLLFQAIMLLILGPMTLGAAIRQDLAGGMIESHRLMPVRSGCAVAGYLFGSTFQAITLAAINFLVGLSIANGAGVAYERWVIINVSMGILALWVWSIVACLSFQWKGAAVVSMVVLLIVSLTGSNWLGALPGLKVLTGPLQVTEYLGRASAEVTTERLLAVAAQLAVAAIFCVGAMRRYRRPDRPALGVAPALLLLGVWVAISYFGAEYWHGLPYVDRWHELAPLRVYFITTMLVGLLLALVPLANAAKATIEWRMHKDLDDPALGRRPMPPLLVVLLCAGVLMFLTFPAYIQYSSLGGRLDEKEAVIRTAAVLVFFLGAVSYLLRVLYRLRLKSAFFSGLFIVLIWVGPFLVDYVRHSLLPENSKEESLTQICTISPVGALIHIWNGEIPTTLGIAAQGVLAATFAAVYYQLAIRRGADESR